MRGIGQRFGWRARLAAAVLTVAILLVGTDALLRPTLRQVACNRASQRITGEIASAVQRLQERRPTLFRQLSRIEGEQDGIRWLSVDAAGTNRLKTEVSLAVTAAFDRPDAQSLRIPLGTLTGWQLLSGLGPEIGVGMQLNGSADCNLRSEFRSGGINQTIHRLVLVITVEAAVLLPFDVSTVRCETEFLISETVLLGITPNFYVQGSPRETKTPEKG